MTAPSSENLAMNAFGPYLAAIHLQDLLDDAALERRARLAHKGQSGVPAWRRSLGVAVRLGRPIARSERRGRASEPVAPKPSRARATAS